MARDLPCVDLNPMCARTARLWPGPFAVRRPAVETNDKLSYRPRMPKSRRRRRPATARRRPARAEGSGGTPEPEPRLSGRVTLPPAPRFRPTWHRVTGIALVVVGVVVVALNLIDRADKSILPGGHNELYFLLGLALAGYGTWWLGLFDRPA
jgi:hypothetical protein